MICNRMSPVEHEARLRLGVAPRFERVGLGQNHAAQGERPGEVASDPNRQPRLRHARGKGRRNSGGKLRDRVGAGHEQHAHFGRLQTPREILDIGRRAHAGGVRCPVKIHRLADHATGILQQCRQACDGVPAFLARGHPAGHHQRSVRGHEIVGQSRQHASIQTGAGSRVVQPDCGYGREVVLEASVVEYAPRSQLTQQKGEQVPLGAGSDGQTVPGPKPGQ
jgi:hypothetical protein